MPPGPVFYPRHLDLTKNECSRILRQLELEAYAGMVSALRSQGDLTKEKKALLTEICAALAITPERHRAEIRRAVNDEKLATIALHSLGFKGDAAWIKEGRRIVPLPARPQLVTAYVEKADQIAEITAKENANLPEPSTTGNMELLKAPPIRIKSPTKPVDFDDKVVVQPFSATMCAKCIEKQCNYADVETSTDDLVISAKDGNLVGISAPSASDSYVFLPGGTTVKVDGGNVVKDETSDAYSIKSSSTGNIDFGSAPEISLAGPRSSKRKRKKSVGSNNTKDFAVKIKKIIRPKERRTEPWVENIPINPLPAAEETRVDIGVTEIETAQQEAARIRPNYEHWPPYEPPRPKKPVSHAITVQHTPVPPEHLYAVGSQKSKTPGLWPPSQKKGSAHRHGPHKRGQSHASQGTRYGNERTATFHPTSPEWFTEPASYDRPRDPLLTTSPRRYSYSPSKAYRPPSIVQNTYGKVLSPASKRYRPTGRFSIEKRRLPGADTQLSASYPGPHRGVDRFDLPGDADGHPPHKILRPGYSTAHHEPRASAAEQSAFATSSQDTRPHHSSGLDELASASLLASELSTATMVKTGLAPVSAIVSRVSSPAPGPLSPMTVAKGSKSAPSREGSARTGHGEVETVPTKHSSMFTQGPRESIATTVAAAGVSKAGGESSVIQPRSVVVIDTKHSSIRQDTSTVTIAGQHPSTQVRLSVPEAQGAPISSVKQISAGPHPPMPRVISTIAGKPHKVLKSSSGNVITVTAKSLPGMKTHPTIVSGASVVKPLGQKTSIIVVHKAAGSKLGKIASESLGAVDPEGSKDITITRNLATPSVILPRPLSEGGPELCPPGSALGSIQGLVSGLTSQGDVLKKTKLTGVKPKFVTMPVQKKTITGRFEPARAKVISSGPGKVLVKASTSVSSLGAAGKVRTFSGSRIVKQVASQTGSSAASAGTQPPGQDIVAAALSQSLGASAVVPPRDHEGIVGLSPGSSAIKVKQEGLSSTGIIKVATSTPAASTIKAFAATYQKNSSASQQKQLLSLSPVQKPVSSVTSIQPGQSEKTKIFLASPAAPKTHHMLFTPNQQLVHRSPQGTSMSRAKTAVQGSKPQVIGSASSQLATIGNLSRSLTKVTHKITQQGSQPQTMQVKVISQPTSASTLRQPWQATSLLGAAKTRSDLDESAVQTKILQDILDSGHPSQNPKPLTPDAPPRSDRATFIYQYHPTTSFSETPHGSRSEGNDVIMLRSVTSDSSITEATRKAQKPVEGGSEMVKVTLPAPVQVQQDAPQNLEEIGVKSVDREEDSSHE